MKSKGPVVLVILDGFGYSLASTNNAIATAHTPFLDGCFAAYPWTLLKASGTAVGLREGAIGNSEVGHLTIGAGRVIKQPIQEIHEAIADGTFYTNSILVSALKQVKQQTGRLHLIGLCSDAQVHSDSAVIAPFLQAAKQAGIPAVFVHLILDGRDVAPQSSMVYLSAVCQVLQKMDYGFLASLHGRFFAMDRDHNNDRTQKSYDVLVGNTQKIEKNWKEIISASYQKGVTDEFIEPILLNPHGYIQKGDGVIFFNTRPDRIRQLAESLFNPSFVTFSTKQLDLSCCVTLVEYGLSIPTQVIFVQQPITDTLKDVLARAHARIFVIAETEKYAHVTYFFTGMREKAVAGETRMLIPSLKVKTYAEHPEMSAAAITKAVLATKGNPYDFYLINYANADMVGHTGDFQATCKAIACLDQQLQQLYDFFIPQLQGTLYITADHGKAEQLFDSITQQPKTAHTTNPVPFFVLSSSVTTTLLPLQELSDIAPYILSQMGLRPPEEMKK